VPRSLRAIFDDPTAPAHPMQMGGFGKSLSPYDANHAGFATNAAADLRQPPWAPSHTPAENLTALVATGPTGAQSTLRAPNFNLEPGDTIRGSLTQITVPSDASEAHASSGHDDTGSATSPEEEHGEMQPPSPTLKISSSPTAHRSPSRQESDPPPSTSQRRAAPRGPSPAPGPLSGYAFPALDPPSPAVPPLPTSAQAHQRLPALYPGAAPLASRHLAATANTHAPFTRSLTSLATPEPPQSASATSPLHSGSGTSLPKPAIARQASVPTLEGTSSGAPGPSSSPASAAVSPRQAPVRSQTQLATLAPIQPLPTRGYRSEPETGAASPNHSTSSTVRPIRRVPSPSGRAPLRVSILPVMRSSIAP
jgi:hypothetical protein